MTLFGSRELFWALVSVTPLIVLTVCGWIWPRPRVGNTRPGPKDKTP